jgi:hypothetical protein
MRSLYFLIPAVALSVFTLERDASACGGCFIPGENVTVVSDHRMILSIAKDKSTLYDQIRYQGEPSSFAWVLPIAGTVDVGLSADIVFSALDTQTQTRILPPPINCPPRPDECDSPSFGATADGGAASNGGVQVLKQEVVGPYETVQLAADDPTALAKWLSANGFVVPADVQPVIDTYVAEQFNFLALKLIPGKGVQDMRPVRVTTTGASAVLPLRMVAAGTGPVVGISLWVIGEGRYEPQNFQSFVITADELLWDWTQNKSNYTDLRAAKTAAGNGRIWEIENSTAPFRQNIEAIIRNGTFPTQGPYPQTEEERAAIDYLQEKDAQGNVTKTAVEARNEDLEALFAGISTSSTARITRMRADLAHAALDQDLAMIASADQGVVPTNRQVVKEANQPQCPVWDGCTSAGTAPRDEAVARSTPPSGSSSSSCTVTHSENPTFLSASLGFAALAVARAMRRRRIAACAASSSSPSQPRSR